MKRSYFDGATGRLWEAFTSGRAAAGRSRRMVGRPPTHQTGQATNPAQDRLFRVAMATVVALPMIFMAGHSHLYAPAANAATGQSQFEVHAASATQAATNSPASASSLVPNFDHVFIVMEENRAASSIIGSSDAPYINQLANSNAIGASYYGIGYSSLQNYLALTAGSNFGITTDCLPTDCPVNATNIADLMDAAGRTWKAYNESMPAPCTLVNSGNYVPRHNPFVYYTDIQGNSARCQSHDVPYTQLAGDLQSASTTPNYVWITPNLQDDMHDGTIAQGDTWLQTNLPAVFNSPAWTTQKSALFILWDEDDGSHGDLIPSLVVSPLVTPGFVSNSWYNHYSIPKTIEQAWGLPSMTTNDANAQGLTNMWTSSVPATISSVNPTSVAPGDLVTVYGSGFGPTEPPSGLYVSDAGQNWGKPINASTLVVNSWSNTKITFTAPVPSGTGNQWRLRPGTTATFCIASNCNVSGSTVQPPSGSFTNTNLSIINTDNLADYYDTTEHIGIAPDVHLQCQSTFNRIDSNSPTAGNFFDADAGAHSLAHPDAGTPLTLGVTYTDASSGLSYIWPNAQPCSYDLIDTGSGTQTILMPPNSGETANTTTVLGFMGLGAGGAYTGSATVTYADGTTSTAGLDTGDWCQSTPSGQTLVVTAKRTDSTVCHVFQWSGTLTSGKVVTSLTIPGGGDSHLRIFSMALGIQSNGPTQTFPWLLWNHPADIAYGTPLSATQLDATAGDPQGDIAGAFDYSANPAGTILNAGAEQPISATFTPTDSTHWVSGTTVATAITVTKADQSITFAPLSDRTFGDAPFSVSATATSGMGVTFTATGSCTSTGPNGATITLTGAGTCAVTASQSGGANYNAATDVQQNFNVNKYTPHLTWTNPSDIAFGTPLSSTQLDAQSDAPGTLAYSPPAATILSVGDAQTLHATFTATDSSDYVTGGSVTATINVKASAPQLSWTNPADITYPAPLSATQLNAQANVAGTFVYNPPAGTVLHAGQGRVLQATFTPTDTANYVSGSTVTAAININKYIAELSWAAPTTITYGAPLTSTQLDATADVAGTFAYSPTAGTVLHAGAAQTLHATFTPTNVSDYVSGGTVSTSLTVNKAPLTITAAGLTLDYSDLLPSLSALPHWSTTGLLNGDTTASLLTPPRCTPKTTVTGKTGRINVKPGKYTIACTGAAASNYTIGYATGTLTVLRDGVGFLYIGPTSVKKGAKVKLTAKLLSDGVSTEPPISGATVTLGFKGGKTCTAKTTAAGVGTCSMTAATKTGTATITMKFPGTVYYVPQSQTAAIKVIS